MINEDHNKKRPLPPEWTTRVQRLIEQNWKLALLVIFLIYCFCGGIFGPDEWYFDPYNR